MSGCLSTELTLRDAQSNGALDSREGLTRGQATTQVVSSCHVGNDEITWVLEAEEVF